MAILRDDEIRRLLKFLGSIIPDKAKFASIEDELRGDFGQEILREPEILDYFSAEIIDIQFDETDWQLRVIPYTKMRLTQRGINSETLRILFSKFLKFCKENNLIISKGAYTIVGKPKPRASLLTLRIDVDEIEEVSAKAHTVTIFVGHGDTSETEEIFLN